MSEYQYYEFQAVDRLLTDKEIRELRSISTRAEITPSSFANVYNWGNLKADPIKLVERYFDLFVYVTNWGTHRMTIRLPKDALNANEVKQHLPGTRAYTQTRAGFAIIDLWSDTEEYEWEEGSGWMTSLVSVREELLSGDLRPLYLAWLLLIQDDEIDEDAIEPLVPAGLKDLSPSQKRMADFLRIDEHLLGVASEHSAEESDYSSEIEPWVRTLPAEEKDRLLLSIATGNDKQVRASLLRRYRNHRGTAGDGSGSRVRRTVSELLTEASRQREEYERLMARRAAEERRRREAEAAAARVEYLDKLARRGKAAWDKVERLIVRRQPKSYDEAAELLQDLRDAAARKDRMAGFEEMLAALQERHARKHSLMSRLRKMGILS